MAFIERSRLLAPLLRDLASDRRLIDELVDAARARSPEVARLPAAETRRHIADLLAAGLASFERFEDPTEHDFAEATRLGAERAAQGIPISGVLRSVQAARTRAFEISIDRGRAAGIPDDVLLEAALELDRYVGALERHIIDGYRAAELTLARNHQDARANLLRRLLLGDPGVPQPGVPHPAEPQPAELARFGLSAGGRYHCLVSDVTDPAQVRVLTQRLSAYGGIFGPVEGRLAGLSPRLPRADSVDATILVVAAPAVPLSQARAGYRLCLAALHAAPRFGSHGLNGVEELAGETALATQPRLAELLRDTLLGALKPTDGFHRELASTALTYLDHGQRLHPTAAALYVHPNTVRYRLRRFHELTGMLSTPVEAAAQLTVLQTVRWWWALHTWLNSADEAARPATGPVFPK